MMKELLSTFPMMIYASTFVAFLYWNEHFRICTFVSCSSFYCYNSYWLFLLFSWSHELINAYIKSKLIKIKNSRQKMLCNPETTFGEFIRLHVVLHDYAASSLATNLHNIDRKKPILAFWCVLRSMIHWLCYF